MLDGQTAERADAARNRVKILVAAERLIAEKGLDNLTVAEVAAKAGVGVGTLYRRFGDRGGLAHALLDEREREFQAAFLYGPPPLGPGAEPEERVQAFLEAHVDYLESHTELMLLTDTSSPGARYRAGAYGAYHAHLAALVREARPEADAEYLAEALLAPLAADLYVHQRRERGMGVRRIKDGLGELLRCLVPDGVRGG